MSCATSCARGLYRESLSDHNGCGRGADPVLAAAGSVSSEMARGNAAKHELGHDHQGPQGVTASGFLYVSMGRQMSDRLS